MLPQRLAIDKLHGDERPPRAAAALLRFAHVINCADIRVVQCRRRLSLAPESLQRRRVLHHVFREELQCNRPLQACVHGLEHHSHSARTKFFDDAVVGDGLADEGVGVRHSAAILGCDLRQVNELGAQDLIGPTAGARQRLVSSIPGKLRGLNRNVEDLVTCCPGIDTSSVRQKTSELGTLLIVFARRRSGLQLARRHR